MCTVFDPMPPYGRFGQTAIKVDVILVQTRLPLAVLPISDPDRANRRLQRYVQNLEVLNGVMP